MKLAFQQVKKKERMKSESLTIPHDGWFELFRENSNQLFFEVD